MDEKAVRGTPPEFDLFEPGCSNVVCFTVMASAILSEQRYKDTKDDFNDEKVRIITAMANLIKVN